MYEKLQVISTVDSLHHSRLVPSKNLETPPVEHGKFTSGIVRNYFQTIIISERSSTMSQNKLKMEANYS